MQCHKCPHYDSIQRGDYVSKPWKDTPCVKCKLGEDTFYSVPFDEENPERTAGFQPALSDFSERTAGGPPAPQYADRCSLSAETPLPASSYALRCPFPVSSFSLLHKFSFVRRGMGGGYSRHQCRTARRPLLTPFRPGSNRTSFR